MANSKIIIEFISIPSVGDNLNFAELTNFQQFIETFKTQRFAAYQCKIPDATDVSIEGEPPVYIYSGFISQFFKTAFNLDYNTSNLFTVTVTNGPTASGLGTVTIEANYLNAIFEEVHTPPCINLTIQNEDYVAPFEIDSIQFSEASTNPCQNVQVSVTTSELIDQVISPVLPSGTVIANPLIFDWPRNQTFNLNITNSIGLQANSLGIQTPSFLSSSNFDIVINNSPSGATVIINNQNTFGLVISYSLDNTTFQSQNIFSGLADGDYTLYVKDNFGCSFSKAFHVDEFGIQSPYFYYSKSNSIRMANRVVWGDSANYKNDENTLSCEAEVDMPKTEIQYFQSADVITCQFRSNFSTRTVKVIKNDDTEDVIPIVQKTQFIGVKDKRDGIKFNAGNGKTGLYFTTGNIYDYTTNAVTGTHQLNGTLPEWAVQGNYFFIGGLFFEIESIIYDESKNADVIIFSGVYTGAQQNVITSAVYNLQPYEVYEFSIDMVNYIDQYIRVKLENSDPNFVTITYLSEILFIKIRHQQTLEIRYKNATNTDVMYSTGIQHLIRLRYIKFGGKSEDQNENHKTDSDVKLLNADLYEGDEILFEPLTKEMWRKAMIALSHENVLINGVAYVKNGQFSTEGPLGQTNWYVLTANMLKSSNVYNSLTTGSTGFNGIDTEIPGLIQSETGFIRY